MKNITHYLFLLLFLLSFSSANSHEIRPTIIDMNIQKNGTFILSVKANIEAIIAKIGSEHKDTDDSPNKKLYYSLRKLSPQLLKSKFNQVADNYTKNIIIKGNNEFIPIIINSITIPKIGNTKISRNSIIKLSGKLPIDTNNITWKYSKYGNNIFKLKQNNKIIANLFITNSSKGRVINLQEKLQSSTMFEYIKIGIAHIIPKGVDHILFILGLFLFSAKIRSLILQISVFTIAHTITLGLSILGFITFSALWIEVLIALSIIYIGIENIFYNKLSNWRLVLIFAFGLLHGMGFASVLKEIGLPTADFVISLIGFNIGVEVGQLLVIFASYIFISLLFKNKIWYKSRVIIPLSIMISLIASYWFVERILIII